VTKFINENLKLLALHHVGSWCTDYRSIRSSSHRCAINQPCVNSAVQSAFSTFNGRLEKQDAYTECLNAEILRWRRESLNLRPIQEWTTSLFMESPNLMLVSPNSASSDPKGESSAVSEQQFINLCHDKHGVNFSQQTFSSLITCQSRKCWRVIEQWLWGSPTAMLASKSCLPRGPCVPTDHQGSTSMNISRCSIVKFLQKFENISNWRKYPVLGHRTTTCI